MQTENLRLKNLSLSQFKNHEELHLVFTKEVSCFVGRNGEGKINILDGIHYLSFCKSYFQHQDVLNIQHEADYFVVKGSFERAEEEHEVYCALKRGSKKVFKRNGKEYKRLADHIGKFPAVMISPSDTDLIREGSEVRRKFIDGIISQYDRSYLKQLIKYNKVLQQRNALLKHFYEHRLFEPESLSIWDEQLITLGEYIFSSRTEFIKKYVGLFKGYHEHVSGGDKVAELVYRSPLQESSMRKLLADNLEKDKAAQRTTQGIHKDDLLLELGGKSLRKFGSQGQQKTFYIGMRLAQYQWLKQTTGVAPLLLLDDIFDKLDSQRVSYLMKLVSQHEFGQIFITDTQPERLEGLFEHIDVGMELLHLPLVHADHNLEWKEHEEG